MGSWEKCIKHIICVLILIFSTTWNQNFPPYQTLGQSGMFVQMHTGVKGPLLLLILIKTGMCQQILLKKKSNITAVSRQT
jgi:hypothetical protein